MWTLGDFFCLLYNGKEIFVNFANIFDASAILTREVNYGDRSFKQAQ